MFPQIFGKYVLEGELAAGGMARVYLATLRGAVGFEKRLVVKQIRPELACDPAFVRRFVEEAKTTVELSHPNIVPVYELGVEQGVYYIAMELCAGITLAEMLQRSGPLSAEEGAHLGVEVCRALDYAHRRAGIIHRDVTPRNVLIDEEGAVRLIDFGIAAPVLAQGRAEVFGSPGHMPPEQLAGLPLSPAADVFAVAALLFEAWTGRPVFRRATARASADATAEGAPPLDEQRPELAPVAALLASGLALNAKQRPAAAEAFARPLRDFLRSVDSGDIARRLGARVLRAKRGPSARPPGSDDSQRTGALSSPRDSRPGSEPTATRTFAAREEVQEWTRRLQSERPPAASDSNPERDAPEEPMQATPAFKHTDGDVPAEVSTRPVSLSSSPPEADDGNHRSPAIQAIQAPTLTAQRKPRTLWLALSGLLLVAGAASGWLRVATLKPMQELSAAALPQTLPVRAANTTTITRVAEPALTAELAAPAISVRSNQAANLRSASTTRARTLPSSASAAAVSASTLRAAENADATAGRLRLTADPPASVSVQGPNGTRAYTTPVHALSLPSGSYVITFVSATYGAPLVTRISVSSGQARSVHADFRELEPRLSVE